MSLGWPLADNTTGDLDARILLHLLEQTRHAVFKVEQLGGIDRAQVH